MTTLDHYEDQLPALTRHHYIAKSDVDPDYNCIAWAAGDVSRHWWPVSTSTLEPPAYWPEGVDRDETLASFIAAFATKGYAVCSDGDFDPEFEKVAIFGKGPECTPTHAARQLPCGRWTSKLNVGIDIEHELDAVGGYEALAYGSVVAFMARPRRGQPPEPRLHWPEGRPKGRPWPVKLQ